tara:strand:+ start:5580 stop:5750 length:171 start_codon:yes stop_codon:yes gene_type:complete
MEYLFLSPGEWSISRKAKYFRCVAVVQKPRKGGLQGGLIGLLHLAKQALFKWERGE